MDNVTRENKKTIAIHQPNFFPWLGYFYKIANCNEFVILDNVDFQQGNATSLTSRARIKCNDKIFYFTVSVKHKRVSNLIKHIVVDKQSTNMKKQFKTLHFTYLKAPFYNEIFPVLEKSILEAMNYDMMVDVNEYLIKCICSLLKISTPIIRASDLNIDTLDRNMRIIEICKILNAGIYLSGGGGAKYHDETLFNKSDIKIKYSDFVEHQYEQLGSGFIPKLSIIDVLFNCGIDKTQKILYGKL